VQYVADALGRSLPSVYAAIHRGEIKVIKIGKIIRVADDVLEELLKGRRLTEVSE
jgi:excisionase family DNA binding protein